MAEKEIYNVQPQEKTGLLLDLRSGPESNNILVIKNYESRKPYLISKGKYTYGLTRPITQEDWNISGGGKSFNTLFPKEIGKYTTNAGVLLDPDIYDSYNTYCLFSRTLLEKCGIGFILSDWLFKDTDGKVKIKFKPKYLKKWFYDDNGNLPSDIGFDNTDLDENKEYIVDDIYSTRYLFKETFPLTIEGSTSYEIQQTLSTKVNYDDSYGLLRNESFPQNAFDYGGVWYLNNVDYYDHTLRTFNLYETPHDGSYASVLVKFKPEYYWRLLVSRLFPGTPLLTFNRANGYGKPNDPANTIDSIDKVIKDYPQKKQEKIKFVFFNFNSANHNGANAENAAAMDNFKNCFLFALLDPDRIKTNDTYNPTLNDMWNKFESMNPQTYDLMSYWDEQTPPNLWIVEESNGCNVYDGSIAVNAYTDNKFIFNNAYWSDGSPIIMQAVVSRIKNILSDISNINSQTIWQKADYTNISYESISYDNEEYVESPQTQLNNFFENIDELGLQTPSQYYSTHDIEIDEDMKDPLAETNDVTTRVWFWLDTLKNWCMYTKNDAGYLYLQCWDGLGGWDRVETIVWAGDNTKKIKYHYLPDFFKEHYVYPNIGSHHGRVPLRTLSNGIAHMYYNSIILTKETKLINYNDNFQSKHNSTIYYEKETVNNNYNNNNAYANWKYGGIKTQDGRDVIVDENRTFAYSVDTQYNPCLIKLLNGDVALVHVMYIEGNSQQNTPFIITPDHANKKCKEIFGDGSDKTIENDWKRIHHDFDWTEEKTSKIVTDPDQLITGAPNLTRMAGSSTINSIKLFANRPNPTTNNLPGDDFVERWK